MIAPRMRIRRLAAAVVAFSFLAADAPPDQICRIWYNQERDAKLEIYWQDDAFEAKIVWLKEPNADGKPKVDKNNPDPSLRIRPTLGLVVLHSLRKTNDPNVYKGGRIYDPKNGKTYNCRLIFKGNTLELRGFVLGLPLLGRTAIWKRAD